MTTPILKTKLYIPPGRTEQVQRSRLIQKLNVGRDRKLTLVSAPAGFGKTTLVSAWVRQSECPVAWLSVDDGDNDPVRFWAYVIAALQTVAEHTPDAQISEQTRQMQQNLKPLVGVAPDETFLTYLINDIASTFPEFIFVLDDLHLLSHIAIHEALTFLLDNNPPQMHLVASSRADPPWPLSRLRARHQMTELRLRDLRFTQDEAITFLNKVMQLSLPTKDALALQSGTEGWIAGLQLAALSIQTREHEPITQLIANFSGRDHFILDYLTDEVLKHQSQSLQDFLLQTSILDTLCGDLCDALLDTPHTSQAILEHLHHRNLFLVPLDNERTWYRFHHLFADLLRARLQEMQPYTMRQLHHRAATWYDQHNFAAEAIHHALAAEAYDWAADMLERALQQLHTRPSVTTAHLQQWLDRFPDDILRAHPRVQLIAARVLYITGQAEQAQRLMQKLESDLKQSPTDPETENLMGLIMADRASYAAVKGEVQQAIDLAQQALTYLPADSLTTRMRAASILGLAHFRAGDVVESEQAFTQAIADATAAGIAFAATPLACNLAEVHIVQGQLRKAIRTCQQGIQMGIVDGKPTGSVGYAYIEMAKVRYQQNDLATAAQYVVDGLERLEQAGTPDSFGTGYAILAQIQQAQGSEAEAQVTIQKACEIAKQSNIARMIHLLCAHQARIWLAQGKMPQANRWATDYRQLGETSYLREFEDLTLVRVLLAESQPNDALALLDKMHAPAESAGRFGSIIEILILRTLALHAQQNLDHAHTTLKQALTLAAPEGYVRIFLDEGEPMATLLSHIHIATHEPSLIQYSQNLLSAFTLPGSMPPHPTTRDPQPLIEPLTNRELDVLHLLAEGLTNPEIAQRLFISLPTVKSHTRNIYGKLGVHNRKQAVTQAEALGILQSR